jgi:sugar transferase (PEP-CTERM/EpsH1 system associated)
MTIERAGAFARRSDGAADPARPSILFLSHCVPNPPDKGEKIRAHHILRRLARAYRVHLVCFARAAGDLEAVQELRAECASIYAEPLAHKPALARGALALATGGSLNAAYFRSRTLERAVSRISRRERLHVSFAYTAVMARYAPADTPVLVDLVDVDSEKWFQYAELRSPGALYRLEARRLRSFERAVVERACFSILTTQNEESLLRTFAPSSRTGFMENGVDAGYFDPARVEVPEILRRSRFLAFVGAMDYCPNVEGVCRFAKTILPELRRRDPSLEFFVVGKNPAAGVRALSAVPGVRVTGAVPDVRPYLAAARAVVAPLALARGIQNKVLEALAMGRPVVASPEVCRTFGDRLPEGLVRYHSDPQAVEAILHACAGDPHSDAAIRNGARERFDWDSNLEVVMNGVERLVGKSVSRAAI